jgi:hypothetical protein
VGNIQLNIGIKYPSYQRCIYGLQGHACSPLFFLGGGPCTFPCLSYPSDFSQMFRTLLRITVNSWKFWEVQGKQHVSAVQHVGLRDVFCLNSADLNKGPENSSIFLLVLKLGPPQLYGALLLCVQHIPINLPLYVTLLQVVYVYNVLTFSFDIYNCFVIQKNTVHLKFTIPYSLYTNIMLLFWITVWYWNI